MWPIVREVAAFVMLAAAVLTALGVVFAKLATSKRWGRERVKAWLDLTVGEVVEARLTGRNGGSSLMDSIDRIELEIGELHKSHGAIGDKVERLSSDVAVVRQLSQERGEAARDRVDQLERHLELVLDAVLHQRPQYTPQPAHRPGEPTP
jgi:hypothetical protein